MWKQYIIAIKKIFSMVYKTPQLKFIWPLQFDFCLKKIHNLCKLGRNE
jgi:hypothetical protein